MYFGEINKQKEELNIYTTDMSVLHITNIDPCASADAKPEYLPVKLLRTLDIAGMADDILYLQICFQNKAVSLVIYSKKGFMDVHELLMKNDSSDPDYHSRFQLVQSSRINFF